jgi:hypothetical protein
MSTKEELLARHGVVNGALAEQLHSDHENDARQSGSEALDHRAPSEAQATTDPLVPPHIVLRNAAHNLDVALYEARQRRAAVSAARENFNIALRDWNLTMPIQTVDGAKRDVIRTNQIERENRAAQGLLRRPMTVTETARAMSGGNRRAGGGAAYKRSGTFTRAEAAKVTMNRSAANRLRAAAKLPSQR